MEFWKTEAQQQMFVGSRTCKPNSVHLAVGRPFLWAAHCCAALATYPEVKRAEPALPPYLVLLRVGFALPAALLRRRCALTAPFHPYPARSASHCEKHCDLSNGRGGMFSVALSVESPTLSRKPRNDGPPSRTLSGTLLCGVRTFLPAHSHNHALDFASVPDRYGITYRVIRMGGATARSGCLPNPL